MFAQQSIHAPCRRLLLICLLLAAGPAGAQQTALEQYAETQDSSYSYSLEKTVYNLLYTTYIIDITSQQWHAGETEPAAWEHWLVIVEPRLLGEYTGFLPLFSRVRTDTAMLRLIHGDNDHEDRPSGASSEAVTLALDHHAVVAELHAVPIGPVLFLDEADDGFDWGDIFDLFGDDADREGRTEDSLLARSFDLAIDTGDMTWAALAPMVKSAVRGMDTTQAFMQPRLRPRCDIKSFLLTGHSKRGWTCWLTAALDSRVAAIAPLSYDSLNLVAQNDLQESSWDERSEELEVFEDFDLYDRMKTPTGQTLVANIDPYNYLGRITVPTLIMIGSSDNYSVVDAVNLYYDDLQGDSRVFYDPNKGHDIRTTSGTMNVLSAFFSHTIAGTALPDFSWSYGADGSYTLTTDTPAPHTVKVWNATSSSGRDFREQSGISWSSTELTAADGTYTGTVAYPPAGKYTAFFLELGYREGKETYTLATTMKVLGD